MSEIRRILHIVEASFAGVGRHVIDLATGQAALGHDVHVVYSSVRESASFRAQRLGTPEVTFHCVDMLRSIGSADVTALRRVSRIVDTLRPHNIHGHSTKGGILARLARRGDAAVLYTPNAVYSMNPLLGVPARRVVGTIERLLALRTDTIIAVSPEEASHLADLGIAASRCVVIPNGIDPESSADKGAIREELSLPSDAIVFGFVGRLDDQKAPLDLVEAFDHLTTLLSGSAANVHLAIVGDGPLRQELEVRASQSAAADRIHLLGEQPGRRTMAAFDVFVLPSRYEGFPYVLLEAAQAGLPIITTDGACASQIIIDTDHGWVVPVNDCVALAEAMAACLNPDVRTQRGEASQRRCSDFTITAMVDRVERVSPLLQPDTLDTSEVHTLSDEDQALLLAARERSRPLTHRTQQRCFDIVGATILLGLSLPIMAMAAIAVGLTSRGPVIFASERHGTNGSTFGARKFRTMVDESDADWATSATPAEVATLAAESKLLDDPRVTTVGKFLRRLSIDELPQLLNIIKGDMSLVGPRPKLLTEKHRYGPAFDTVLSVRPGLTGLWQTSGRNDLPYEARITLDLTYVATRSLRSDLAICARTARQLVSLRRHGAY